MSEQIETAFAEYQQEQGVRPGTFVAYDVVGGRIADLTTPAALTGYGATPGELFEPWKEIAWIEQRDPTPWRLADQLRPDFDGVRVPSVQYAGGVNVVLWRWNESGGPVVTYHDPNIELGVRES